MVTKLNSSLVPRLILTWRKSHGEIDDSILEQVSQPVDQWACSVTRAEFLRLPCKRRMPSKMECARAEAKFAANPWTRLAVSTKLPAFVSTDSVLTVSRAMKLGPGQKRPWPPSVHGLHVIPDLIMCSPYFLIECWTHHITFISIINASVVISFKFARIIYNFPEELGVGWCWT